MGKTGSELSSNHFAMKKRFRDLQQMFEGIKKTTEEYFNSDTYSRYMLA